MKKTFTLFTAVTLLLGATATPADAFLLHMWGAKHQIKSALRDAKPGCAEAKRNYRKAIDTKSPQESQMLERYVRACY